MLTYTIYLLSVVFVLSLVGVSSKPSPIYGGLGLVIGGGAGCGVVLGYGGSFLGLMVFLIYLGGMLVVFGYTTAMAMEEYSDSLESNSIMLVMMVVFLLVECLLYVYASYSGKAHVIVDAKDMYDWVIFENDGTGYVYEDSAGVAAMYTYGCWLLILGGWTLFVSILIVIEITRGG
uniref:NADH-ubiquinone oxidoreductase chain 6 n=1 Tax=Zenkerella insignis TaxID=101669 RepID=A0A343EVV1_9RODE|nr:NADH dehydrogenase subunit 6 [Zenkerella insignis]ASM91487.1 NADH dehydrogenase subunit 6 [Zenkerella insignis]